MKGPPGPREPQFDSIYRAYLLMGERNQAPSLRVGQPLGGGSGRILIAGEYQPDYSFVPQVAV